MSKQLLDRVIRKNQFAISRAIEGRPLNRNHCVILAIIWPYVFETPACPDQMRTGEWVVSK